MCYYVGCVGEGRGRVLVGPENVAFMVRYREILLAQATDDK